MAENKKRKRQKKRKKPYPPLSKTDKLLYIIFDVLGAIVLFGSVFGYLYFAPKIVFKNPDVLAFKERTTIFLIFPFFFVWLIVLFDSTRKRLPVFGNKKVDYYNTLKFRFVLPLFDKRYQHIESCQKAKKKFFKKASIWSVVFAMLFGIGLLGYTGRHEFHDNGITTYSVFNNPIKEYSYDEVESYEISAERDIHIGHGKYSTSYTTYYLYLTVRLNNGKSFSAEYGFTRDIHAMKELDSLLAGKPKTTDAAHLTEFINRHDFTDSELKVLYELFEQ
ncbi:MAG: hypothetical protein E7538_04455 [Ruminococcaceae bacterium]|nr:hypothetical protein [Oscillospiraceae bacterium]